VTFRYHFGVKPRAVITASSIVARNQRGPEYVSGESLPPICESTKSQDWLLEDHAKQVADLPFFEKSSPCMGGHYPAGTWKVKLPEAGIIMMILMLIMVIMLILIIKLVTVVLITLIIILIIIVTAIKIIT
jgi:hypothetical protein